MGCFTGYLWCWPSRWPKLFCYCVMCFISCILPAGCVYWECVDISFWHKLVPCMVYAVLGPLWLSVSLYFWYSPSDTLVIRCVEFFYPFMRRYLTSLWVNFLCMLAIYWTVYLTPCPLVCSRKFLSFMHRGLPSSRSYITYDWTDSFMLNLLNFIYFTPIVFTVHIHIFLSKGGGGSVACTPQHA